MKLAGQILSESDSQMRLMLFAQVKAAHARLNFDKVVWEGAHEMNRREERDYPRLFANLMAKRMLFTTPGKGTSVWEAFAAILLRHSGHPKAIQHFAINFSAAYTREPVTTSGTHGGIQQISGHPEWGRGL